MSASGDPQVDETAAEIGLGRRWVMSSLGRADAAERWHEGDYGPDAPMSRSTKRVCRDCGFFLPLAGSLGTMFGVCGNELSADGHVVDKQYGCGAHSDTPAPAGTGSALYEPYDDGVLEVTEKPKGSWQRTRQRLRRKHQQRPRRKLRRRSRWKPPRKPRQNRRISPSRRRL